MTGDLEIKADLYLDNVQDGETWLEFKTPLATIFHREDEKIEFKEDGIMYLRGMVQVENPPERDEEICRKDYVDSAIKASGIEVTSSTPSSPAVGKMWFDTSKNALYLKTE